MTSSDDHGFLPNADLPPQDYIVAVCKEDLEGRGTPLSSQPGGPVVAWVKYGPYVTIHEALTQDYVAKELNAMPETTVRAPRVYAFFTTPTTSWTIGHIVMEYIDAPDSTFEDVSLVAQAVQKLISIRGPSSVPGHIGGGPVIHSFFVFDEISPFIYQGARDLQSHVNGILRHMPDNRRVDLVADASDGLFLCPCDIHPGNFKKLPDNTIVALDFRHACFMPPSFFGVAMRKQNHVFGQVMDQYLTYPKSKDVSAMVAASYYLVPFQKNDVGAPRRLRRHGLY